MEAEIQHNEAVMGFWNELMEENEGSFEMNMDRILQIIQPKPGKRKAMGRSLASGLHLAITYTGAKAKWRRWNL